MTIDTTFTAGNWVLAAWWTAAFAAALFALRLATGGRPWFYRGRRRAPGWWRRWRERRAEVVHEGATEAYADQLHALADQPPPPELALRGFTPPEGLPTAKVIDRMFDDQEALLEADTRRTFDRVYQPTLDDAVIRFRMAFGRLEADWARRPVPTCADRGAARDRVDEATGAWDIRELMAVGVR